MISGSGQQPGFIPIESIQWDSSWPKLASRDEKEAIFSYMEKRFGISRKCFDEYVLFKRSKSWWLLRESPHISEAAKLKVEVVGIRAFHKVGRFIKPTTRMVQCFGHLATRGIVRINWAQLDRLASGERLAVDIPLEDGYVILSLQEGPIVGVGFWAKGYLSSKIPRKELRKEMFIMPLRI